MVIIWQGHNKGHNMAGSGCVRIVLPKIYYLKREYLDITTFFLLFWLRKLPEFYFLAQAFTNLHGKRRQGKFI